MTKVFTKEVENLLARLEGCITVARSDAQTILVGADRTSYFADVARWNRDNIEELAVHFRSLLEELEGQYRNIEEYPFPSEEVTY